MPSSPARPLSRAFCTVSEEAESASLIWYDAWLVSVPPPKAAMKPEEPMVTW